MDLPQLPNCPFVLTTHFNDEGKPFKDHSEPYNSHVTLSALIFDVIQAHPDLVKRILGDNDYMIITTKIEREYEST